MSSNNAFGVTTIYLRFSHGRSHHHGDPLRKRDDLIKNNRTRPFSSIQQPQQLGIVTTYSKLIWPLDLILARKEIIKWATDESEEGQFGQDQFQKCNWVILEESICVIVWRRQHWSKLREILHILAGVLNKICNRTPDLSKVWLYEFAACLGCWGSDFSNTELGLCNSTRDAQALKRLFVVPSCFEPSVLKFTVPCLGNLTAEGAQTSMKFELDFIFEKMLPISEQVWLKIPRTGILMGGFCHFLILQKKMSRSQENLPFSHLFSVQVELLKMVCVFV